MGPETANFQALAKSEMIERDALICIEYPREIGALSPGRLVEADGCEEDVGGSHLAVFVSGENSQLFKTCSCEVVNSF